MNLFHALPIALITSLALSLTFGCSKKSEPPDNSAPKSEAPLASTPIHDAVRADNIEKVLELLKADPNASTGQNVTLIQIAQEKGYQRTMQMLRQYGGR